MTVLGHGDPTGVDSGHRVDGRGHDLGEDLFQVTDAVSGDQVPRGAAQGKDECIGLIGLDGFGLHGFGLHGAVPPSRRSTGCSTETCAGAAEPKAACAALYPRHDEATDAHETTEYRERMATKTCAPYVEKRPLARP